MFVDRPTDAAAYKLHQLFRLKPAVPHVVTLPLDDLQFDFSAKFSISLSQQGRKVLLLKIDPALPAPEQVCSTLNHLEHNLWEMKVYAEAIKQFSQAKLTSLLHGLAADFDHIILINEPLNGQVALTLMSVMDINLFCLDTRLSPAKNILSLGLIQEEFALPQVHILLNRQGYNPNILIESWNVSVKLLRKFHSKIRPHNNA